MGCWRVTCDDCDYLTKRDDHFAAIQASVNHRMGNDHTTDIEYDEE